MSPWIRNDHGPSSPWAHRDMIRWCPPRLASPPSVRETGQERHGCHGGAQRLRCFRPSESPTSRLGYPKGLQHFAQLGDLRGADADPASPGTSLAMGCGYLPGPASAPGDPRKYRRKGPGWDAFTGARCRPGSTPGLAAKPQDVAAPTRTVLWAQQGARAAWRPSGPAARRPGGPAARRPDGSQGLTDRSRWDIVR